ncbi:MAG: hypothetical protein JOZ96_00205 [Acidobacteria bacterium]|nr:hypothetical protein [Acidobacteriota bacterium]
MREPQRQTLLEEEQTLVVGGEETTLVAPRFDDEETLVARPVVPLEAEEFEAAPEPQPARPYTRADAPRRSWMLALVLVSVLVGGVLGGAGLYLYQRQSQDPAAPPAATTQPAAPNDAAQTPAPAPAEAERPQPAAPQHEAPAAVEATAPGPVEEAPAAAPARESASVPAGAPKRGKKGDRDEEVERRTTTPPKGNVARAEQPEARKVDTIFYRPRRTERRARRGDDVDRLRRIFEGTPQ